MPSLLGDSRVQSSIVEIQSRTDEHNINGKQSNSSQEQCRKNQYHFVRSASLN